MPCCSLPSVTGIVSQNLTEKVIREGRSYRGTLKRRTNRGDGNKVFRLPTEGEDRFVLPAEAEIRQSLPYLLDVAYPDRAAPVPAEKAPLRRVEDRSPALNRLGPGTQRKQGPVSRGERDPSRLGLRATNTCPGD